jgi:drug/metabolite transporter (DMT)-like permease
MDDVLVGDRAAAGLEWRFTLVGLVSVLFWSASVGLLRGIAERQGALGGAALVYTASAVLSWLLAGAPRVRLGDPRYFVAGGAAFVGYEVCLMLSLGLARSRTQALELAMINYLWPCLTIVLAVVSGQQRASRLVWLGAGLSLGGIVWVMSSADGALAARSLRHLRADPLVYALAFLAALLWAVYSVLTRRFAPSQGDLSVFLLVTAALFWIGYAALGRPTLTPDWSSGAQVLVIGVLTATAYACWNVGVRKGNLTLLAAASYFTPILSMWLASLWLQTPVSPGFWQGVAMVTAGSLTCWWSTHRRPAA